MCLKETESSILIAKKRMLNVECFNNKYFNNKYLYLAVCMVSQKGTSHNLCINCIEESMSSSGIPLLKLVTGGFLV